MNRSTNRAHGLNLAARFGLALLLATTVQAQIAIQDGSLTITPPASASINQSFTVTPGASVLVVLLEDYGARLDEPATLTWNSQTLTRDNQTAYNYGTQRSMAIYHLFNPVPGTANITGTDTGVSETWVTAYTLTNVNTAIAPITGSTNTGTVAAGVNSPSINLTGVPSGAWAAVNAMFANASGLVGCSGTSGMATSVNDTNEQNTDVSVGCVTNLGAGAVTLTATYTDTPGSGNGAQKANFAVDVFSPSSTNPAPPVITATPVWSPTSVVVGQTASITVIPAGTAPFYYQWMAGVTNSGNYANLTNGGNLSGVTNATWFLHS